MFSFWLYFNVTLQINVEINYYSRNIKLFSTTKELNIVLLSIVNVIVKS